MAEEGVKLDYSAMECSICLDLMKEEILLCNQGHSICKKCYSNDIKVCPQCRSGYNNQRNYQLEELIKNSIPVYEIVENIDKIKCSFCEVMQLKNQINKHEANCQFRKIACAFTRNGCQEKLNKNEINKHELECGFRKVKCHYTKNGCDMLLPTNEIEQHENFCEYRKILHPDFNQNLLRCHQCKNYLITPPILAFPNNKFGCSQCFAKIENGTFKYLQLMAEIDLVLQFPCVYKKNGCKDILSLSNSAIHEKSCAYRELRCKFIKCAWFGYIQNYKTHVLEEHKDNVSFLQESQRGYIADLKIADLKGFKSFLIYGDHVFVFRIASDNLKVSFNVLYIGSYEQAFKTKYEVRVGGFRKSAFCTSDAFLDELYVFREDRMVDWERNAFLPEFEKSNKNVQVAIYML